MADRLENRPGFRDLKQQYVDIGAGAYWAEKVVVVNPDGTPIAGGGGGGGTQYAEDTASAAAELLMMAGVVRKDVAATLVDADGDRTELQVDATGLLRVRVDAGGSGGGVVQQGARDATVQNWFTDPQDRAARLVGIVYGDVGQVAQRAVSRDALVQLRTAGVEYDARSIRTLTSADVVDMSDRAGRLVGVITAANLDVALSTRLKPADTLTGVTTVTSLTQMNGQAIAMGTGVRSAGTQRVTIATDDVVPVTGAFFQATQPVSMVDGASVALGATADVKVTGDTAGTVSAKLRGLSYLVNAVTDVPGGRTRTYATIDGSTVTLTADVTDRAARLVGVVYGSQGQQLKQTAVNFNAATEIHVGAAAIDPRSIRTLTSADVVDISDRAARENGRVRLWDGTDEATILPVRTQPATTEKVLLVGELPIRTATYAVTTITVTPAITIGVKELLALWYTGGTKDIYIVEIWASGIVTTASTTGGRTSVRVSTITTAPTGGTEEAKVDVAGAGASAITNTMRTKTGGGAIGSTFIRKLAWHATQAIGSTFRESLFSASNPGNGLIMRGGVSSGFSIDVEREVAHTALVDSWTVGVRWLEL